MTVSTGTPSDGWPADVVDQATVLVDGFADLARTTIDEVSARFRRFGFVRMRAGSSESVSAASVEVIEHQLGLGERYLSPAYATRPEYAATAGIATLRKVPEPDHLTFDGSSEQALHVDGTLEALGHVRTLLLVCGGAAHRGGHSTLFNSVAAYDELVGSDPDAAAALTRDCLMRDGAHFGQYRKTVGPAFGRDEEGLLHARYSTTEDGHWDVDRGGADLRRALDALSAMSSGGRHRCDLLLESGDAILIANDRLAHGRTAFEDLGHRRRVLYRSLYCARPTTGE